MSLIKKIESFEKQLRRRLFAVLMPHSSGKTTLCNNLGNSGATSPNNRKTIHVDVDNLAANSPEITNSPIVRKGPSQMKNVLIFPIIKAKVKEILDSFKNSNVILFTASKELVDFLEIKAKRLKVFIPSTELWTDIKKTVKDDISGFEKIRDTMIKEHGSVASFYDSFTVLESIVKETFGLIKKL